MIPRGSSRITIRNTPEYRMRYQRAVEAFCASNCWAGTSSTAPSSGPHSVPLPPRYTINTMPIVTSGSTANCG